MSKVKRSRIKKKEWLDSLKDHPCMDCEESYPPFVMDWHHVRGEKLFGLGDTIANNISRERILEEIKKCDLVCANCHRIRHNMVS